MPPPPPPVSGLAGARWARAAGFAVAPPPVTTWSPAASVASPAGATAAWVPDTSVMLTGTRTSLPLRWTNTRPCEPATMAAEAEPVVLPHGDAPLAGAAPLPAPAAIVAGSQGRVFV